MPKDLVEANSTDPDTILPLLRKPTAEDGAEIWKLVSRCKPLDENSMYCNLIQADHFRDTCVVAERNGRIVGWISGHMIPGEDTLFVWQVAVCPTARGLGLGGRMLTELLTRDGSAETRALKTTITRSNAASWGLFRGFARRIGGDLSEASHFHEDTHFDGQAPTEHLVTITLPQKFVGLRRVA